MMFNGEVEKVMQKRRVEDVSLVDGVFDGALGGDGDDDFAIGDLEAIDSEEEEEEYDEDDEEKNHLHSTMYLRPKILSEKDGEQRYNLEHLMSLIIRLEKDAVKRCRRVHVEFKLSVQKRLLVKKAKGISAEFIGAKRQALVQRSMAKNHTLGARGSLVRRPRLGRVVEGRVESVKNRDHNVTDCNASISQFTSSTSYLKGLRVLDIVLRKTFLADAFKYMRPTMLLEDFFLQGNFGTSGQSSDSVPNRHVDST
ncbi:hypothetical protein Tco_0126970 [Tanacetum coccineum]